MTEVTLFCKNCNILEWYCCFWSNISNSQFLPYRPIDIRPPRFNLPYPPPKKKKQKKRKKKRKKCENDEVDRITTKPTNDDFGFYSKRHRCFNEPLLSQPLPKALPCHWSPLITNAYSLAYYNQFKSHAYLLYLSRRVSFSIFSILKICALPGGIVVLNCAFAVWNSLQPGDKGIRLKSPFS